MASLQQGRVPPSRVLLVACSGAFLAGVAVFTIASFAVRRGTDRCLAEGPVVAVNIARGGSSSPTRSSGHNGRRHARDGSGRVPALGETLLLTMMIGSGGAVAAAVAHGAIVVTPATLGVGLLEHTGGDLSLSNLARSSSSTGYLTTGYASTSGVSVGGPEDG